MAGRIAKCYRLTLLLQNPVLRQPRDAEGFTHSLMMMMMRIADSELDESCSHLFRADWMGTDGATVHSLVLQPHRGVNL